MRYVVFPSYYSKNELIPSLSDLIIDSDISIIAGPTPNGLYLINGSKVSIDLLKFMASPYYLFMEDF